MTTDARNTDKGTTPTFSVVISLYNKEATVERAVRSVLAQDFADFELVVVDDGSTDDGAEVVAGIEDPRLKLVRQENGGVSRARNRGIKESSGRTVAFLDADDAWEPTFLGAVARLQEAFPEAGLYATGYRRFLHDGRVMEITISPPEGFGGQIQFDDYFRRAQEKGIVIPSCAAVPRHVLDEVGLFPPGEHGEDMDMWGRIAIRYPVAYDRGSHSRHHLDAGGHSLIKDKPDRPLPFIRSARRALEAGEVPAGKETDLRDYLDSIWLGTCYRAVRLGSRARAIEILRREMHSSGRYAGASRLLKLLLGVLPTRLVYLFWKACRSRLGAKFSWLLPTGLARYWG